MAAILFLWNVSEDSFPLNLDIHFFLGGVAWDSKPLLWFVSFSLSLFEEALLGLLEAVWTSRITSLLDIVVLGEEMTGFFFTELLEALRASKVTSLLDEVVSSEVVTGSFFTSSSIFCKHISKAVWSLDLRLACLVVGSLTKGFSKAGVGSLGLPG